MSFTPHDDDLDAWLSMSQRTEFLSPPTAESPWRSYRRPHANSFNSTTTVSSPPHSPMGKIGVSPAIGNLDLSFDPDLFPMDLDPVPPPSAGIKRRHTGDPPSSNSWMDAFFSTFPDVADPPVKRRRSWQRCSCICPDIPVPGQKLLLHQIPTEILLLIFEFAFLSPEKPPRCDHTPDLDLGITRRATLGADITPASVDKQEKTEDLRIFRARTLLNIMLTCRRFNLILAEDYGTDESLWRSAARWCWEWLPEKLADVQGRNLASQTSWRNLVAVFMRCENGLFGKKGAGKGGAESFGGKKGGISVKSLKERKGDGKVVMVIGQPGPDGFSVDMNPHGNCWTVSMTLRGDPTAEYFVTIDERGNFGKPSRVRNELRRNERSPSYWPQDIFAVDGDRTQMVRVGGRSAVHEQISWDLTAIPEFVMDKNASVARCVSRDGLLICSLYTHGNLVLTGTELEQMLEPPEDPRIFCIETITPPPDGLSAVRRRNLPASNTPSTVLRWSKTFAHPKIVDFAPDQHLHPVLCSLAVNSTYFVALVRWNTRTSASPETFESRVFHVLSPQTGDVLRALEFPFLYWDYRHHDMSADYNLLRVQKLEALYNHIPPHDTIGAGNRATRVHDDKILLTDDHRLISGSHDYCNWIWPLDRPPPEEKGTYNATTNHAGKFDSFTVLDDFYWSSQESETPGQWTCTSERAGWWVRTPNQVLCFWHSFSLSSAHRYFAASRPGRLFLWDLKKHDNVRAYEFQPGPERWTGKLRKKELWSKVRNWFMWEEVLPRPGLWMVEEGGDVFWAEAEEIRRAVGVAQGWWFEDGDFESVKEDVAG